MPIEDVYQEVVASGSPFVLPDWAALEMETNPFSGEVDFQMNGSS